MKKLALLLVVSLLASGCQKEEPPLTDEELEKKDYLEKKIKGYLVSTFQVWIDNSDYYLLDVSLSDTLMFELYPEDKELRVEITDKSGESENLRTQTYRYSDMIYVNLYRLPDNVRGLIVVLNESYSTD